MRNLYLLQKVSTLSVLSALLPILGNAFLSPPRRLADDQHRSLLPHSSVSSPTTLFLSSGDQTLEALQSLTDFHEGTWKGIARSFTVTPDVVAGIVQRKTSPPYTCRVQLGANVAERDFTLTETMEWEAEGATTAVSSRKLSLGQSSTDVDAVDASYSLDTTLPDFPPALVGTDKLKQFMIEHCIAVNNNQRSRCLAFYGVDQSLIRIVICQEERVVDDATTGDDETTTTTTTDASGQQTTTLSAQDLIEMQGDVDRLVDKITDSMKSNGDNEALSAATKDATDSTTGLDKLQQSMAQASSDDNQDNALTPHGVSLLEVSSGVWLGDSIIRDIPMVPVSPLQVGGGKKGKGFGKKPTSSSTENNSRPERVPFASWSVGVQKVAWRWMWNFGEEIRQVNDFGKSMGAELAEALTKDLSGSVCVNEGLSRRIPQDERMVYIDWNEDNVGFLSGSHSVQVPRYLNFDASRRLRPFYTEFCVYQEADGVPREGAGDALESEEEQMALPDVVCSKIARVYNYEGRLKQGCTSFYTLKRFGMEVE